MSDPLLKRIEELEKRLAELEARSSKPEVHPPVISLSPFTTPRPEPDPIPQPVWRDDPPPIPVPETSLLKSSENWLARAGIALLIVGVCFFLKYSFDHGWISPLLRVLVGGGIAAGLLIFGEILRKTRLHYAQALSGGGVAVGYGAILAAHHLYHLIGIGIALALFVTVAALCFIQSVRFKAPVLGIIATIGAYLSPYLLFLRIGSLGSLSVYYAIILAVVYVVYVRHGWKALFFVGLFGAWAGLFIPLHITSFTPFFGFDLLQGFARGTGWEPFIHFWKKTSSDAYLASGTLVLFWLGANAVTSWRIHLDKGKGSAEFYTSVLIAPVVTLYFITLAMAIHTKEFLGWMALAFSATSFVIVIAAWAGGEKKLVRANAISGTLLLFISIPALVTGHALCFLALTLVFASHFIGRKMSDRIFQCFGHLASLYVFFFGVLGNLVACFYHRNFSLHNPDLLTAMACNFGLLFTAWWLLRGVNGAIYRIAAWVGFLMLLLAWTGAKDIQWINSLFLLTTFAFVLHGIAHWKNFSETKIVAHVCLFASLTSTAILLLTQPHPRVLIFQTPLFSLVGIFLCLVGIFITLPFPRQVKKVLFVGTHILFLLAVWHEFARYAPQLVSISWAIYAVILMVAGVRRESHLAKSLGISVILILLARLFFVDTAQLSQIWRIVVFIGIGLLLLIGGYFLPRMMKKTVTSV